MNIFGHVRRIDAKHFVVIDSSIIASVAQKLHGGIQTYSIGFGQNKFFDEPREASLTAEKLGCKHHNIVLEDNSIELGLGDFFDNWHNEYLSNKDHTNESAFSKTISQYDNVIGSGKLELLKK